MATLSLRRIFAATTLAFASLFLMPQMVEAQKYTTGGTVSEPVSAPTPSKNTTTKTNTTTSTTKKESSNLELIGMLGGQSVYNMYLVIGAIADNFASGNYEADTASELLDVQVLFSERIAEKFRTLLSEQELVESDKEVLNDMVKLYTGLQKQAKFAKAFIGGDEDAAANFEAQRKKNWADISALLGIE
jgi:DUF1680 family protein